MRFSPKSSHALPSSPPAAAAPLLRAAARGSAWSESTAGPAWELGRLAWFSRALTLHLVAPRRRTRARGPVRNSPHGPGRLRAAGGDHGRALLLRAGGVASGGAGYGAPQLLQGGQVNAWLGLGSLIENTEASDLRLLRGERRAVLGVRCSPCASAGVLRRRLSRPHRVCLRGKNALRLGEGELF